MHDTSIQTQDSYFEPCRSEFEHASSRSRRLPAILNRDGRTEKKRLVSLKHEYPERVTDLSLRVTGVSVNPLTAKLFNFRFDNMEVNDYEILLIYAPFYL